MPLDFGYVLRTMRRNAGHGMTAMICLALAMGVNATLFTFLDSMYFRSCLCRDRTASCRFIASAPGCAGDGAILRTFATGCNRCRWRRG
jgi:hypothetical protein